MNKHYIIGDVHGEYQTLLALIERLPKDAKLIFVGDLIDRGLESAEVVKLVRIFGHACVMGNHENEMIYAGTQIANTLLVDEEVNMDSFFGNEGYGILTAYCVETGELVTKVNESFLR